MIVIDCSYALALVMPDAVRPASMHAVMRDSLVAPMIWPLEIANAFRSSLRRKRLQERQIAELCAGVMEFDVEVVGAAHVTPQRYFDAALAHDLTPYDALYLDLAVQRRCALATCDDLLSAAAERAGVHIHR